MFWVPPSFKQGEERKLGNHMGHSSWGDPPKLSGSNHVIELGIWNHSVLIAFLKIE